MAKTRLAAVPKPDDPLVLPNRISDESLAYLNRLLEHQRQIQTSLGTLHQLIAQQYSIGPQDKLNIQDGTITRVTPEKAE